MLASNEATRRESEIQMEEDEKEEGQTRKCILLIEEPKEAHEKKDKDNNEKDIIVLYDNKCKKVYIFFNKQQSMGTYCL